MKPFEVVNSLDKLQKHFYLVDTPFGKNKTMMFLYHHGTKCWILHETWDTGWWTINNNPNDYVNTNYNIVNFIESKNR